MNANSKKTRYYVENRLYDISHARCLGNCQEDVHGIPVICSLYHKHNGEYFLFVSARRPEDASQILSPVQPLGYRDAEAWGKKCMMIEDYDHHFGDLNAAPDGGDRKNISLYIPAAVHAQAKRLAAASSMSMSQYVSRLICDAVNAENAATMMPAPVGPVDPEELI